jgi:D-3-phosphoglycerate dehydrogenase / 2-oxoglutarate reductase
LTALTDLFARQPQFTVTADLTDEALDALRGIGRVRLLGWAAAEWFATEDQVRTAIADADILIAGYEPITADLLASAPRLRVIASVRSEPRTNIDVEAATARGILVICAPGRTNDAVAEFTVAVVLALARRLVPAVDWMRHRPSSFVPGDPFYSKTVTWGLPPTPTHLAFGGFELAGRTLGLIGLGSIGRAVARKLSGFDMRLVGHDPFIGPDAIGRLGVELLSLRDVLAESDVVSLHARLSPATRQMLGRAEFAMMKDGAYFVNTARAELVDRGALVESLMSGKLAGAALDVYDDEPPAPDDPLIALANVLPTPHIAGWTKDLVRHHSEPLIEDLRRLASGQRPRNIANPEAMGS